MIPINNSNYTSFIKNLNDFCKRHFVFNNLNLANLVTITGNMTGAQLVDAINTNFSQTVLQAGVSAADINQKLQALDTRKYAAGVCLSFDDPQSNLGDISTWITANTALSAFNWKATFAISTASTNTTITQDEDEITSYLSQFNTLLASGHELANHTLRHIQELSYLSTHTVQQLVDDRIVPLQTILTNIVGVTPSTFILANDYGMSEAITKSIMDIATYFDFARINAFGYPQLGTQVFYDGTNKIVYGLDLSTYDDKHYTNQQIIDLLTYARDYNLVLLLFTHKIGTAYGSLTTPLSVLQMICQFIVDNNMSFYKMNQLKKEIFIN